MVTTPPKKEKKKKSTVVVYSSRSEWRVLQRTVIMREMAPIGEMAPGACFTA